jgi:hypothetical protein
VNGGGKKKPADPCEKCKTTPKLVKITVIRNATQANVTGAKNWAAIKKASDDVIVEATTTPNTEDAWRQVAWSGDSGSPVAGHTNQRSLSRAASKKLHIEAALGGVTDSLDVWILWGTVTIKTSGPRPANAVAFAGRYDGTEDLGAKEYDGGAKAVGKVVPVAKITPAGVHDVVKAGWAFRRHMQGESWDDGVADTGDPRFFKSPAWVDDTSDSAFQNLTPDADDQIYDRDAPNVAGFGTTDSEIYYNFEQWIEWGGASCSDMAQWHWRGRWQKSATPQITLKDVGTGTVPLPGQSFFHPPSPPPSPSKGCFIASAAYGSPMAVEVRFLQEARDSVLRRTRWGRQFFDEYWKHYYRLSPAVAAQIDRDPELRRIVRWSIITPMLNYLKLLMDRPAHWDLEGLEPEWKRFLTTMKCDMDEFLRCIELPEDFDGLSNDAAVDELNIAIDFVLKEPARIEGYLERLTAAGALPLKGTAGEIEALRTRLRDAGRSASEISRILYGA